MIQLAPISTLDKNIPIIMDFSNIISSGDTISTIGEIIVTEGVMTVASPAIVNGLDASCAVRCLIESGTPGAVVLTGIVNTVAGQTFARSITLQVNPVV